MHPRISLLLVLPLLGACSTYRPRAVPPERPTAPQIQTAAFDTVWFYLDGEQIERADVVMIDQALIASITHLVGPAARARYGPSARAVVEIVAKRDVADRARAEHSSPSPLYVLDGRQVAKALVSVLDTRAISSVEVLKGPAALIFGEKARAGVILIASNAGMRL